jgi:hypothetical protein
MRRGRNSLFVVLTAFGLALPLTLSSEREHVPQKATMVRKWPPLDLNYVDERRVVQRFVLSRTRLRVRFEWMQCIRGCREIVQRGQAANSALFIR